LQQKYKNRHCQCGCSFCINIPYSADGNTCHIKEGTIPDDDFDVKENLDNCDKGNEVTLLRNSATQLSYTGDIAIL